MSASLYVKDPATSRYVAGGLSEVKALFGTPLPALPALQSDGGRRVFLVHTHARLRSLLHRFLEGLLAQIGLTELAPRGDVARIGAEYEAGLGRVLRAVRTADRAQGLLNLFWLAHSRDAAEHLRTLEPRAPNLRRARLSLFPLLQSFYRRVDRASPVPSEGEVVATAVDNPALIDSIIDDGFAFTETSVEELDLEAFLASNKRYRISSEVFFEIQGTLVKEAERRLRQGDRALLARARTHLSGIPREHHLDPRSLSMLVLCEPLLTSLLADPFGAAVRLASSPLLRAESDRGRALEDFQSFIDLAAGLRRFEVVSNVRERIVPLGTTTPAPALDLEEKTRKGLRVYEFGEAAQVLNHAVPATVLFLDLRGFTSTSEGQISERDLTRELYAVFDAFVPIIEQFGGTVDKYLGDGMMVTWGTDRRDVLDPLKAIRAAVLCQQSLRRKRESGATWFKMGIAIHHGRVYLARFVAGEGAVQATVIGRNVNLAGRLSSASRRSTDQAAGGAPSSPGAGVSVDREGKLFNEGIAISRETLAQLEEHLALVHTERGMEYEDDVIDRHLVIRYAGDAKFKGVRSSLPVYAVEDEERGESGPTVHALADEVRDDG